MLKALLIKLRQKPKVVREQVALVVAGAFTFIILGVWAISLPGHLSGVSETQTAGFFSTLREEVGDLATEFEPIMNEIPEEESLPAVEESETVSIPNEYRVENQAITTTSTPSIRIATTSVPVASSTENNQ